MRHLLIILICSIVCMTRAFGQAGQLDPMFGTDGKYSYLEGSKSMHLFGMQSDNKLIGAASDFHMSDVGSQQDIYTARFLADGGIDSSYGIHGFSTYLEGTGETKDIFDITIQPDDKILVAGRTTYLSKENFFICRFNADGSTDSAFGTNGFVMIPITVGSTDYAIATAVTADNKIVLSGMAGSIPAFVRLHSSGVVDSSFGTFGIAVIDDLPYSTTLVDAKVQNDGKIVSGLYVYDASVPFGVLRLNSNGVRDSGFGTSGFTTIGFTDVTAIRGIMIQSDNKILVAGRMRRPGTDLYDEAIARLNTSGTLDGSFGSSGRVVTTIPNGMGSNIRYLIQPIDGKIVSFHYINDPDGNRKYQTIRYLSNGTIDSEWNGSGRRVDSFNEDHYYHNPINIFYTNEGKIVFVGSSYFSLMGDDANINFARLSSCGVNIIDQPTDVFGVTGGLATFTLESSSPSAVYQWQILDEDVWIDITDDMPQYSGTHTNTLTISALSTDNDGDRYRAIAISGSCTDTSDAALLTVSPTSIRNQYFQAFGIFPNPVTSNLLALDRGSHREILNVNVTDQAGKWVHSLRDDYSSTASEVIHINTQSWTAGIYYIQVSTDSGESITYKIIKL